MKWTGATLLISVCVATVVGCAQDRRPQPNPGVYASEGHTDHLSEQSAAAENSLPLIDRYPDADEGEF